MNIIFLDFDGVLNCQIFYEGLGDIPSGDYLSKNICRKRLTWIEDLCKDSDCKVVISSSHRSGRTPEFFQALFDDWGFEIQVIGLTPFLYYCDNQEKDTMPSVSRGSEIKYWLNETTIPYRNYVIIDDNSDMLLEQVPHFFQTDEYAGLTPIICNRIANFFIKFK